MLRSTLVLFIGAALAALVAALGAGRQANVSAASAPSFSLEIKGDACGGFTGCDIVPGSIFTVTVHIDKLNVPDRDGDTTAGYRGFEVQLSTSSTGPTPLEYVNRPGTDEVVWPGCEFPVQSKPSTTVYQAGCIIAPTTPESTYLGALVAVDYQCNGGGPEYYTITLVNGLASGETHLLDEDYNAVAPEAGPAKELTLRCHFFPTPPPTATPGAVGGVAELPASSDGRPPVAEQPEGRTSIPALPTVLIPAGAIFTLGWLLRGRLVRRR